MATEITTTSQDIDGDFDLVLRGSSTGDRVALLKSLGSATSNWVVVEQFSAAGHHFVKNTGTNAFKLGTNSSGLTVEFSQ